MKHDLRKENLILCEPSRFEARLQVLDEFDLNSRARISPPSKRARADSGDDDGDESDPPNWWEVEDYWGDPLPRMQLAGNVAVVPIKGIISQDIPRMFRAFGFCDLAQVRSDTGKALAMPGVSSIVYNFDSPGGTVRGVPETAQMIAQSNMVKPCYSYAGGDMCSAAYWIGAGCRGIMAAPSAEVGSIGAYTYNVDVTGFFQKLGVAVNLFASGKYKAAGLEGVPLSDAQKEQIQGRIDSLGAQFRAHVAQYRKGIEQSTMEGQSFPGSQAVNLGLCDEVIPDMDQLLGALNR